MVLSTNEFTINIPKVHLALAAWYALHGRRDLPWRNTRDAYPIYISEIMLQQTQVKTVLERYYHPFLKAFPTLAALAKADSGDVMKRWEGLGYYTRAANLHAAARASGGALPDTVEGLLALPGIGRNTAHAVACFGFGLPVPVMEANVKRVLCRVFALKTPDNVTLWEKAELLLDRKNAFDYNQAMMDIGATVCTRRAPRCGECPLNVICQGKISPESYPSPKIKKAVPVRKRVIVAFADRQGRYALKRRDTRFLGGLYGFLEYEENANYVEFADKRYSIKDAMLLGAVIQTYSHFQLQAKIYLIPEVNFKSGTNITSAVLEDMALLPLSRADHKIMRLLEAYEASAILPPHKG